MTMKADRTVDGKTYTIHDMFPVIDSAIADFARDNYLGEDWFPAPNLWKMIADMVHDHGSIPFDHPPCFIEALAKHYVGAETPDEPDPHFWRKMEKRFPLCFQK